MKDLIIDELITNKTITIPLMLLKVYQKLGLNEKELIFLCYLLNIGNNAFNPDKISEDLSIEVNDVLTLIHTLDEKGFLRLVVEEDSNIHTEVIKLDRYYQKLKLLLITQTNETNSIFEKIEKEFSRTISPLEYEIINKWKENNYNDEIIQLALEEAVFNNARSIRYIDKILHEWNKKGIREKKDYDRLKQNNQESEKLNLFDYDWLNEE